MDVASKNTETDKLKRSVYPPRSLDIKASWSAAYRVSIEYILRNVVGISLWSRRRLANSSLARSFSTKNRFDTALDLNPAMPMWRLLSEARWERFQVIAGSIQLNSLASGSVLVEQKPLARPRCIISDLIEFSSRSEAKTWPHCLLKLKMLRIGRGPKPNPSDYDDVLA